MFKVGDKIIAIREPEGYATNYKLDTIYRVCNIIPGDGWLRVEWPRYTDGMGFRIRDFRLAERSIPEMILSGEFDG